MTVAINWGLYVDFQMKRGLTLAASGIILSLALVGCQTGAFDDGVVRSNEPRPIEHTAFGDAFRGLRTTPEVEYYASDQAVAAAKNHFREGNYGNAGALFHKAVQLAPNDGVAWLGLAASADRVRRFDLSGQAYREAHRLIGNTPAYFNNVGYSHLLQGNLVEARRNFLRAYELAPGDPTVQNNLALLSSSVRNIQR